MSIELVMPSNHLILHCPLLLLPSIFPSIRVFSNESALGAGGQNTGVWALTSVLPVNTQDRFPLDELVGSPCSQRDSQESSPTPQFKSINCSVLSPLYSPTLTSIHHHWKTIALTRQTFVGKVISLLYNILSKLVIIFLPRSKRLLISWLQTQFAVILEPPPPPK